MRPTFKASAIALASGVAAIGFASGASAQSSEPIKIGVILPLTGAGAGLGDRKSVV